MEHKYKDDSKINSSNVISSTRAASEGQLDLGDIRPSIISQMKSENINRTTEGRDISFNERKDIESAMA